MIANSTRSESAQLSNGLVKKDYDRLILGLNKLDAYLAQYNDEDSQNDRPQYTVFQRAANAGGTTAV